MKISSFFKKFNHEKNRIKNYPNTNIFSYKNALYPHELNPEINPIMQDVYEYLRIQDSNTEIPAIRTTYKFVDSNNNTIFSALDNGLKLFPAKSATELINDNEDIISTIYRQMITNDEFFFSTVMPYINRAAVMCLTLPASEGSHDSLPGGLFRHSLCTALECIRIELNRTKETDSLKQRNLKCAAFLTGLNHDLAKIFTDYTIYANDLKFDPYIESLEHFRIRTNTEQLIIEFNPARKGKHDELTSLSLCLLLQGQPQILAYIQQYCDLTDFYLQQHELFKSVKQADVSSVKANATNADPYSLNVNALLIDNLLSLLNESSFEDLKSLGVFIIPYGLLIAYDSPLIAEMNEKAKNFIAGDNPITKNDRWQHLIIEWRRQGHIMLNGRQVVYAWHQLTKKDDEYLIYGVTLKIKTKNLNNYPNLLCNAIALGPYPQHLNSYLKTLGDNIPGVISLREKKDPRFAIENEFTEESKLQDTLKNSMPIYNNGLELSKNYKKITSEKRKSIAKEQRKINKIKIKQTINETQIFSKTKFNIKPEDEATESIKGPLEKEDLYSIPRDLYDLDEFSASKAGVSDVTPNEIEVNKNQYNDTTRITLFNQNHENSGLDVKTSATHENKSEKSNLALESWLSAYTPPTKYEKGNPHRKS